MTSPHPTSQEVPSQAEAASAQRLHDTWSLWVDHPKLAPAGSDDWKDNLHRLATFDTVEGFWRAFNHVKPASIYEIGANLSLFRIGIEPAWEDARNMDGGKFVLTLPKKAGSAEQLDEYWLYTVLALLGETMDLTGTQINGAVVSLRKNQNRIALWTSGTERNTCVAIGERWKKVLRLEKEKLSYQTHKASAATGRSFRNKPLFEI